MDKRGGGYQDFPPEVFCLTLPQIFFREILYCCINFVYRKSLDKMGEVSSFPWKILCLTVLKNFSAESFSVSLISGIDKTYASVGYVTIFDFLSKVYCLTVPKIFAGEPLSAVFQKVSGSEKVCG